MLVTRDARPLVEGVNASNESWRDYEALARHVLGHFAKTLGISDVEAKQRLLGRSGSRWEIDAKAITADGHGFLVVECKERTNPTATIPQETIASLAYRIKDLGAAGGVIITSVELQRGAELVAKHEAISHVFLGHESTFAEYLARCGDLVVRKLRPEQVTVSVSLVGAYYKPAAEEKK